MARGWKKALTKDLRVLCVSPSHLVLTTANFQYLYKIFINFDKPLLWICSETKIGSKNTRQIRVCSRSSSCRTTPQSNFLIQRMSQANCFTPQTNINYHKLIFVLFLPGEATYLKHTLGQKPITVQATCREKFQKKKKMLPLFFFAINNWPCGVGLSHFSGCPNSKSQWLLMRARKHAQCLEFCQVKSFLFPNVHALFFI